MFVSCVNRIERHNAQPCIHITKHQWAKQVKKQIFISKTQSKKIDNDSNHDNARFDHAATTTNAIMCATMMATTNAITHATTAVTTNVIIHAMIMTAMNAIMHAMTVVATNTMMHGMVTAATNIITSVTMMVITSPMMHVSMMVTTNARRHVMVVEGIIFLLSRNRRRKQVNSDVLPLGVFHID